MADTNTEPTVVSPNAAMAKPEGLATENDQVDSAGEQDRIRDNTAGSQPGRGVQPQPAGPQKLDLQPADAQQPFRIKDIQVGKPDGRQVAVTHIYACQSGEYAIYKAEQVMIAFATDPETAKFQRKLILPLSTTRAELNSLILGLDRRELFDQKLAYALQLALDGDTDGAKETLTAAKASVLAKRAAAGRFQYLKWSYGAAAVLLGLLSLVSRFYPFQESSSNLWLAGMAGLVGAVFSIALAIRRRTVALDTERLDNVTDGVLRLSIGIISAGVLLLLFGSGILPTFKVGDAEFSGMDLTWQRVLVIGFVAGFLERLVPDLLEKKNSHANGSNKTEGAAVPVA